MDPGIDWLASRGLRPRLGANAFERYRYLAGDDEARVSDFNAALASPGVGAIIAARGGYGTMRLLPRIDWDMWDSHPKPLVGFSDLTALQLALFTRCGLVSYSGFAPAADVSEKTKPPQMVSGSLLDLLVERRPTPLSGSGCTRSGHTRGTVLGGCLSLVACLLGTPWMPSLDGCILLLEDVGEDPYRIDRMLTQLGLASVWRQVSGVVFGQFHNCPDPHGYLEALYEEVAAQVDGPVVWGAPYGHQRERIVVPIGATAKLEARAGEWLLAFESP